MKPSEVTFSKLKVVIYKNAVRLFIDSCQMFNLKSYPTAYALSILALEEIGKLEMVDHICDDISINDKESTSDLIKHLFSKDMFRSHKSKQAWGIGTMYLEASPKSIKHIADGKLDMDKQDAFYVGYFGSRLKDPAKISARKAYLEMRNVLARFHTIQDIGFNGFRGFSDYRTRSKARYYLKKLDKHFSSIKSPKGLNSKLTKSLYLSN